MQTHTLKKQMTEAKVPAPLIATILRERARLFEIIDNLQLGWQQRNIWGLKS